MNSEGVFIERGSFFVREWGWFVLPAASTFKPRAGTDPSFRQVHGRVYWYQIEG
jgi:hypothetical protein